MSRGFLKSIDPASCSISDLLPVLLPAVVQWSCKTRRTDYYPLATARSSLRPVNYPHCPANTPPPFCNLILSTKRRGAYTRDATFSLAITPSLPVPRPQRRVQIEDNAFDDFAVAIWKDVINFIHVAVPCRNRRLFRRVFWSHCCWTSVKGGAHTCFVDVWISNDLRSAYEPPTPLTAQRYDRNTRLNNLRFLHGSATHSCQ